MAAGAAQRRIHEGQSYILNGLSDEDLVRRYCLDRAGIILVTNLVRRALTGPNARNKTLTPEVKVLITLQYLATGNMLFCGDFFGIVSQQTVSEAITETITALSSNSILRLFIKFPISPEDTQRKKAEFMKIAAFPGVVGVIDGAHIRISAPEDHVGEYLNRRYQHTINVQLVFDAKYRILDIVARWPGSVRDARILSNSGLNILFEEGRVPPGCHVLGDGEYPSKKWLLTPYARPQPGPQSHYNMAHKKTRTVAERGISQLRLRFQVLQHEITATPPSKVCRIITVCALLHNICMVRNINMPVEAPAEDHGEDDHYVNHPRVQEIPPPGARRTCEGRRYRDAFAYHHFNNDE